MKRSALVGLVVIAAAAAAGVTALLVNIIERKQEARNPYFRVVDLDGLGIDGRLVGRTNVALRSAKGIVLV